MRRILALIFLALIIVTACFILLKSKSFTYNPQTDTQIHLVNNCTVTPPAQPTSSVNDKKIVTNGLTPKDFGNQYYNYFFSFPTTDWYWNENFIQHYMMEIAYPPVEYSVNFSYPQAQQNATSFDLQNVSIEFLVFNSYCQPLDTWFGLLSDKGDLKKEYITINGIKAIRATSTKYHNVAYVLMNNGPWHYEFDMEVKDKKDFPKDLQILNQLINSFTTYHPFYEED